MRRDNRRVITVGLLLLIAVAIIMLSRQGGPLRPVVSVLMAPFRPVTRLLSDGAVAATNLSEQSEDVATLQQQVRELERTVAELQVELVRLREIERDYDRLAGLADYAGAHPDQNLVTADVIGRDTSGYLRWIIINRGTREGVQIGNPVISDLGLVGRVENAYANAALVRLIIDPGSAVNARLQDARAEGTVAGQLQGGLRMNFIPLEAVVEVDDRVVTSGLGGTFPPNIVIGQVTSVDRQQAEIHQQAEVRSSIDFDRLELVSVIISFEPVDLSIFDEDLEDEEEANSP